MSINKAQGQSLSSVGVDLRKDVFTHGQLYVAISRARSQGGAKVFVGEDNNNKVQNCVFEGVFD